MRALALDFASTLPRWVVADLRGTGAATRSSLLEVALAPSSCGYDVTVPLSLVAGRRGSLLAVFIVIVPPGAS